MSGREEGGPRCLGCHWQTGPHNYQSDRTARPADDLNIALLNVHPSKHIPHHLPTYPQQHTADILAIPTRTLPLSPHAGSQLRVPKPEPGMCLHILTAL